MNWGIALAYTTSTKTIAATHKEAKTQATT